MRVVQVGSTHLAGAHAGFSYVANGLFAGASLIARQGKLETYGGVGVLLGPPAGPTHLMTAGHLFTRGIGAAGRVWAGRPGYAAYEVGELVANGLDLGGRTVDAALVKLSAPGRKLALESRTLAKTRPVTASDATPGERLQCFGARLRKWSALTRAGQPTSAVFKLWAPRREEYWLADALRTTHPVTAPGDSGGPYFAIDRPGHVVALCAGGDAVASTGQPLVAALSRLGIMEAIWG